MPGFGQMLARPLFRERHRPDMSEEEATELLHEGLRVRKPAGYAHGMVLESAALACQGI
jgi:20S proteasome alpha/beta subunit